MHRHEIRKLRLEQLVTEAGTAAALSRLTGVSEAYISQIRSGTKLPSGKARNVGDDAAAKLERGMGKLEGWMDSQPLSVDDTTQGQSLGNVTLTTSPAPPGGNVAPALTPRQQALLDLFEGLTESQQDELLRSAEAKKQKNDADFEELLKLKQRRGQDAG